MDKLTCENCTHNGGYPDCDGSCDEAEIERLVVTNAALVAESGKLQDECKRLIRYIGEHIDGDEAERLAKHWCDSCVLPDAWEGASKRADAAEQERDALKASLREWEELESKMCPEGVGFEEFVLALTKKIEPLVVLLLTEFGFGGPGDGSISEFAVKILTEQRAKLARVREYVGTWVPRDVPEASHRDGVLAILDGKGT
jgi:hypothetical protein